MHKYERKQRSVQIISLLNDKFTKASMYALGKQEKLLLQVLRETKLSGNYKSEQMRITAC